MNTVQLLGRLTANPELKQPGATPICEMRLAIPRRDREVAPVFIDVVAFAGLAEVCAANLAKGRQIAVSGRLDYSQWKAEDGTSRSRHKVIANEIDFVGPKPDGDPEPAA